MSYEPTNWKTGDVVTSAKLNKLENGVANGGALKLNFTIDTETGIVTIDRTFAEIKEAVLSGVNVFGVTLLGSKYNIVYLSYLQESEDPEDEYYSVGFGNFSTDIMVLEAETENDYPAFTITEPGKG